MSTRRPEQSRPRLGLGRPGLGLRALLLGVGLIIALPMVATARAPKRAGAKRIALRVLRIKVKGNRRVEKETILRELVTRVDDILSQIYEHNVENWKAPV